MDFYSKKVLVSPNPKIRTLLGVPSPSFAAHSPVLTSSGTTCFRIFWVGVGEYDFDFWHVAAQLASGFRAGWLGGDFALLIHSGTTCLTGF